MTPDTVLIIGEDGDWSAGAVADELAARGVPAVRFDTADFPQRARLTARFEQHRSSRWTGRIDTVDGTIALDRVGAVYYRKPRDFEFPPAMSAPERRFARAQARVGVGGVLSSLPARWINHPAALADAEYKPRQLATAAECGLLTATTLITNDPGEVERFAAGTSRLVVKALAEPMVHEGGGITSVYTRQTTTADLSGVEVTAHLFQHWVDNAYEVRLTAVGHRLFPVAIKAGSAAAHVDYRTDYDNVAYDVVTCPRSVATGVANYLAEQQLVFGAFDFVVRPDGEWIFLECNGAGQWGWLAEESELPIASAIADALVDGW